MTVVRIDINLTREKPMEISYAKVERESKKYLYLARPGKKARPLARTALHRPILSSPVSGVYFLLSETEDRIAVESSEAMQLVMDAFIVNMAIAWLITLGILRVVNALRVRKVRKAIQNFRGETSFGRNWWIALVFGLLLILCGIIGLFAPAAIVETIGTLMGISIIVSGANLIHFGTSLWMVG